MPNSVSTVRPALSLLQRSLMRQERRASHEEHRERRQADVGHAVVLVAPQAFALIGQTAQTFFRSEIRELRRSRRQRVEIQPRRQAKLSSAMRSRREIRELLQIGLGQTPPRVSGNRWMRVPRIENR